MTEMNKINFNKKCWIVVMKELLGLYPNVCRIIKFQVT